jgi:hypothetical protein
MKEAGCYRYLKGRPRQAPARGLEVILVSDFDLQGILVLVRQSEQRVLSECERGLAKRLKRQRNRKPNGIQDASVTNIIGACFGQVKEWW